jgi:integrative and conjugative element protein (TIGR02256 family)
MPTARSPVTRRKGNTRQPRTASITESALSDATTAALAALPAETGGILVGWRCDDNVHIADALVVHDSQAQFHTYRRAQEAAQEHLDAYLADHHDPNLGYVGEWHTHPLPQPPSLLDLHSLRGAARHLTDAIALLVIAVNQGGHTTPHARIATRSRFNRTTVSTARLNIIKPDTNERLGEAPQ